MKATISSISFITILLLFGFRTSQLAEVSGIVTDAAYGNPVAGVHVAVKNTSKNTGTDQKGHYKIQVEKGNILQFSMIGYQRIEVKYTGQRSINIALKTDQTPLNEIVVIGGGRMTKSTLTGAVSSIGGSPLMIRGYGSTEYQNTESYTGSNENRFLDPLNNPLSTFGIDVDAASYSNIRRFINQGQLPPPDAVRIEEMINYFDYEYPQPSQKEDLVIHTELSYAPWNKQHQLLKIGLQGKKMDMTKIPASNLVLLIDVSGSMNSYNKLPLVKSSLKMLVNQLREKDHVAIVTYAGAASLALKPTSGTHKRAILDVIDNLRAGGSTAGGAGLTMAYDLASKHFIKNGNNRVIMATDGDFNIGESSDSQMQHLIEEKKESGVYLSVLGFGMGNLKDSKMEILADKGNGNYAYIDNINEGRKVLVTEFGGTLFTIAKDVKLQVEFNPSKVQAYRLIGYENRLLNKEDFNNDAKDGGDLGAGHSVTAFYEIIPTGVKSKFIESVDSLKYQRNQISSPGLSNELATVKIRYKKPESDKSSLLVANIANKPSLLKETSVDFQFAAAVASYGAILKKSGFVQDQTLAQTAALAAASVGKDNEGFRSEFVRLVKASALLAEDLLTSTEN